VKRLARNFKASNVAAVLAAILRQEQKNFNEPRENGVMNVAL
jgi:hypothetical protein